MLSDTLAGQLIPIQTNQLHTCTVLILGMLFFCCCLIALHSKFRILLPFIYLSVSKLVSVPWLFYASTKYLCVFCWLAFKLCGSIDSYTIKNHHRLTAMSIVYIHFNSTQYLIDSWTSRFISFPRTTEHFNHYSAINCFVSIQKIKFLDKLYSKLDWIEFMKTCKCNNTCVLMVNACGFGYCCFSGLSIFINGNVVIKSNKIVILCKRGNSKWTDLFA